MQRLLCYSLFFLCLSLSACSNHLPASVPQKSITITVTPAGYAYIGKDTLAIEDLAKELQTRFWKSYLGTGKTQDRIHLVFNGEVLMGTRGAAMDAIHEGQQLALKDICLQRYKTLYDALTKKQQAKLKKLFPVLFQTMY